MTKKERTVRVQRLSDGTWLQVFDDGSTAPLPPANIDWDRINAMTPEDIEYNALMDPDFEPFLTDADREIIKTLPDAKRIRKKLKLTQREFSEQFNIPLGTLRDWERRVRFPDSSARAYLQVISEEPEAVLRALARGKMLKMPEPQRDQKKQVA